MRSSKQKLIRNPILVLFVATVLFHIVFVLAIHQFDIRPFYVADDVSYHNAAAEISQRIQQGNFSTEGIRVHSWYIFILAGWYSITSQSALMGGVLGAIFAGFTALAIYALSREIQVRKNIALLVAFIGANLYPSYLYISSITLRDAAIVPLAIWGLWLGLRLVSQKKWVYPAAALFATSFVLFQIKGIMATILLYALLFSVLFLRSFPWKQRIAAFTVVFALLAFIPYISGSSSGPFMYNSVLQQFAPQYANTPPYRGMDSPLELTVYLRNTGYSDSGLGSTSLTKDAEFDSEKPLSVENLISFSRSFASTLLGPFPWQMKRPAHWLSLIETVPWLAILPFAVLGFVKDIREDRRVLPLVVFALFLMLAIALISNNSGFDMRVRIPAFLALLAVAPLGLMSRNQENNKATEQ